MLTEACPGANYNSLRRLFVILERFKLHSKFYNALLALENHGNESKEDENILKIVAAPCMNTLVK